MTEIQPLSREMIRRYLDEDDAEYEIDEDGNFVFEYDYDDDCACELTVWLAVEREGLYSIEAATERNFPRADWNRLLNICNQWNDNERYPTAYLFTDDLGPDEVDVRLDYFVYLPSGATQRQIHDLTEDVIERCFDFWQWAHREHGL